MESGFLAHRARQMQEVAAQYKIQAGDAVRLAGDAMKVRQIHVSSPDALAGALAALAGCRQADLALVFGAPARLAQPGVFAQLAQAFPAAVVAGCSTAGEIAGQRVADDSLVINAIEFAKVGVSAAVTELAGMDDSQAAGRRLGEQLAGGRPRCVLLFGQGVAINGSALIEGMREALGDAVAITGGLAGDATRFRETVVLTPAGPSSTALVAVGLAGDALRFSHGSFGGWEPFGTLRRVTRAAGNVLFELDGQPALEIYKQYLGDYARELPASALLFPFEMVDAARSSTGVIRTILGIDERDGSLTLAGDIDPEGYLRLMHASADRLVGGAEAAAEAAAGMPARPAAGLALLVSCVGRKLVMGDRVEEEVEAVGEIFGPGTVLTGFYSYGEICPFAAGAPCRLHNQTMTVTWIGEEG